MKAKKSAARLSLGVAMRRRRLAEATSAFCGTADIAGLTIGSTRSRMTLIGLIDRFGPSVLTSRKEALGTDGRHTPPHRRVLASEELFLGGGMRWRGFVQTVVLSTALPPMVRAQ